MVGWVVANSVGQGPRPAIKGRQAGDATPGRQGGPVISMYSELPCGEIAIEEFEQAALDRLRVLKGLEDLQAKGFRPDQVADKVLALVDQHLKARPHGHGLLEFSQGHAGALHGRALHARGRCSWMGMLS